VSARLVIDVEVGKTNATARGQRAQLALRMGERVLTMRM
jgi:hypothetical protein